MTEQAPSNQWNTPWRASGFAVYDTSGNLVAHTGITGNRSMHGKQLEMMAAMIAEAVNAYSAGEPPAVPAHVRLLKDIYDDGQDCHPPGYIARKGEIVEVREVRTLSVAHAGVTDSSFVVMAGEYEPASSQPPTSEPLTALRQTLCAVGIVGNIDGHDVIRRDSVIELIDRARSSSQPPGVPPNVVAAATRVSNQVILHDEDDQFSTDLRMLVAHVAGECDKCAKERQRGCNHCCWCGSTLTKGENHG